MTHTTGSQFWFKSPLFQIEPGEDEQTNPGCFGRSLASWMRQQLSAKGYQAEELIPEDWGWCVVADRKPARLWVGCGNVQEQGDSAPADKAPSAAEVVWTCFTVSEPSALAQWFKKPASQAALDRLTSEVQAILQAEAAIQLVEEP